MTANHLLRARRFLWGSCAAMVLVIQLGGASQAALTRANTQFEALPLVRSRQNHLLVHAFINGRPAWLTVDSGAPVSAIALNRREYFRLKPITAKSSLPARVQINGAFNNVAIARELRIGGLILADEPVVTVDLGGSARAARMAHEPQIDGIIGADILFPTQAVLDCERQLLVLKIDPNVVGSFPGFSRRGLRAVGRFTTRCRPARRGNIATSPRHHRLRHPHAVSTVANAPTVRLSFRAKLKNLSIFCS